jgi:hypothetical protein
MTNGNSADLKPSQKWTDRQKAVTEWENKIACHGGRHVTTREIACFEDGFEAAREALSVCANGGELRDFQRELANYFEDVGDPHGAIMIRNFADLSRADGGKGEAVKCMLCGETEPYTGTCGSGGDPRALCNATPQAEWPSVATDEGECAPRATSAEYETAIETLRHVIECLRKNGSYTDDEGEATDFLEPLLAECAPREAQPVATLHDDGYWTWKKGITPPHESNYAGWRMDVYAAPQAECAPLDKQEADELKKCYQEGHHDGYSEGYAAGLVMKSAEQEREALIQKGLDDHLRRIQRNEDGWKGNPDVDTAPQAECAPTAFQALKTALLADDQYAWAWHCNLAMPIMDSIHCTPEEANKAGADLMKYLFSIDVRKFKEWHQDDPQAECAPREAQPEPESACNPADICAGCRCEYSQSAAPTPERAQESAGVRLTPEQSGAIQIAISILTPEYLLTANRLRSIVATIDAELAKKEGA